MIVRIISAIFTNIDKKHYHETIVNLIPNLKKFLEAK